jgi:predicted short-subunit dehydrogenase-like oxidoreductase (DUF2520 family)
MNPPQDISIIGLGRLGSCLALALKKANFLIAFVSDVKLNRAKKIALLVDAQIINPPYSELEKSNLIFLIVPDREIAKLANTLAETNIEWQSKTVVHCSGALTSDILKPLKDQGAKTLSFHPCQTFPLKSESHRFRGIYFAVEGDDFTTGKYLAQVLGGTAFRLSKKDKVLYHIAACIASNYLFGLAATAQKTAVLAGIEEKKALNILLPLMLGTLESVKEYGLKEGLTGPIARGDFTTVKKHLEALEKYPELKKYYIFFAQGLLSFTEINPNIKIRFGRLFEKSILNMLKV